MVFFNILVAGIGLSLLLALWAALIRYPREVGIKIPPFESSHPDKVEQTAELKSSAVFCCVLADVSKLPHPNTTKTTPLRVLLLTLEVVGILYISVAGIG